MKKMQRIAIANRKTKTQESNSISLSFEDAIKRYLINRSVSRMSQSN
jgi:hypothetical protein